MDLHEFMSSYKYKAKKKNVKPSVDGASPSAINLRSHERNNGAC